MEKIIIITGPTAVGKTKASIALAKHYETDLINGDAYQIYQKMNIGTAKPTLLELSEVKHHLIDFLPPTSTYSVGDYQKDVRKVIEELIQNNKLPIIVGGTGLYLESVFMNYEFTAPKRDPYFLEQFKDLSNEELYKILCDLDKTTAQTIHMNNRKRVLRAIEIIHEGYEKGTRKNEYLYKPLVLFLDDDRDVLYERINSRVDVMLKEGLLEEAKALLSSGLSQTARAAIGYKEWIPYFDGNCSLNETVEQIKKASRNYAKRQLTWFRNKEYAHVLKINATNFDETIQQLKKQIDQFLKD